MTAKETVATRSYVFRVEVAEEDDGRWSAWIEVLPGCATWGATRAAALAALHDAAQAYVDTLREEGRSVPVDDSVQTLNEPVVAVSV